MVENKKKTMTVHKALSYYTVPLKKRHVKKAYELALGKMYVKGKSYSCIKNI